MALVSTGLIIGGIDFNKIVLGRKRLVKFKIANPSRTPLIIHSIFISQLNHLPTSFNPQHNFYSNQSQPFSLPTPLAFPYTLQPGCEHETTISFHPTSPGQFTALLTIIPHSSPIQQISLSGEAELPTTPTQILYDSPQTTPHNTHHSHYPHHHGHYYNNYNPSFNHFASSPQTPEVTNEAVFSNNTPQTPYTLRSPYNLHVSYNSPPAHIHNPQQQQQQQQQNFYSTPPQSYHQANRTVPQHSNGSPFTPLFLDLDEVSQTTQIPFATQPNHSSFAPIPLVVTQKQASSNVHSSFDIDERARYLRGNFSNTIPPPSLHSVPISSLGGIDPAVNILSSLKANRNVGVQVSLKKNDHTHMHKEKENHANKGTEIEDLNTDYEGLELKELPQEDSINSFANENGEEIVLDDKKGKHVTFSSLVEKDGSPIPFDNKAVSDDSEIEIEIENSSVVDTKQSNHSNGGSTESEFSESNSSVSKESAQVIHKLESRIAKLEKSFENLLSETNHVMHGASDSPKKRTEEEEGFLSSPSDSPRKDEEALRKMTEEDKKLLAELTTVNTPAHKKTNTLYSPFWRDFISSNHHDYSPSLDKWAHQYNPTTPLPAKEKPKFLSSPKPSPFNDEINHQTTPTKSIFEKNSESLLSSPETKTPSRIPKIKVSEFPDVISNLPTTPYLPPTSSSRRFSST